MTIAIVGKVLFWAWIVSEMLVVLLTRTRRAEGDVQDRGSMLVLWVVIFGAIFFGQSISAAHRGFPMHVGHWIRYVVVGLMAVGLAIRWTAILTLGRSFSVNVAIHATQTLQRRGLFRWMRHPSYTGMMVLFLAVGLDTRNWLGLGMIMVLSMAALLYRMHVEEAALTGAFGEEYVEYSRTTKRLIPGVY